MSENVPPPTPIYPPIDLPTLFADTIGNASYDPGVVRLYFVRNDPALNQPGAPLQQPVAQLVMPTNGLINAFVFLEKIVNDLVDRDIVSTDELKELRDQATGGVHER